MVLQFVLFIFRVLLITHQGRQLSAEDSAICFENHPDCGVVTGTNDLFERSDRHHDLWLIAQICHNYLQIINSKFSSFWQSEGISFEFWIIFAILFDLRHDSSFCATNLLDYYSICPIMFVRSLNSKIYCPSSSSRFYWQMSILIFNGYILENEII